MSKHPIAGVRRRNKIAGQFSWRLIEMLESPAYRTLSLSAHRVLDRLEVELAHHGGHDNGALPVTYADFENYGIDRHCIGAAPREVEALGFVRVIERGRAGNAEFRVPNKFALTYRAVKYANPTDDWRKVQAVEQAEVIAIAARTPTKRPRKKNKNPVGVFTNFHRGNPHRKLHFHTGETPTTAIPGKPPLLSISRGGDGALAPMSATADGDGIVKPAVARKRLRRAT